MHARMKPKAHRFTYRVFNLMIDLGRLEEANRLSAVFSIGRFNLLSFHERDHGAGGATGLRAHALALLAEAGLAMPQGRVLLWCYPRVLGFAFNPISVYYCYDGEDGLRALIYEVRNTFGEKHTYVAPLAPGEADAAGIRQSRDKLFYVSPFMGMAMRYHFRLRPPGEDMAVRILETDAEGPILAATFMGRRRTLRTAEVLRQCVRLPLMTLKVVAGINWEALKL